MEHWKGFGTKAIHAGQDPKQWSSKAVIPPITMSITFEQEEPGSDGQYHYARYDNPTRSSLERALASLESAKYALTFSAGLAAVTSLSYLLKSGDHIVCGDDVYGGVVANFTDLVSKMGIEVTFVDASDVTNVKSAIKSNTKMLWLESLTNPTIRFYDIRKIAEVAKRISNLLLIVDNTFMTSYFLKPLELGADIVMYSATKYINGHTDVLMGAIVTNNDQVYKQLNEIRKYLGTVPSPFECFLANRGLKTLHLRMEQHMKNSLAVAQFLESHPMVVGVRHPGLKSHPQYELAQRQSTGSSGMLAFYIKGGAKEANAFVKALNVFILAVSLGGVESLVAIPISMTHYQLSEEQKKAAGITDNLIRLSVGVETTEDLIADLKQALNAAAKA